jgi:hypothetical protein
MEIQSAFNSGLQGLDKSNEQMNKAASDIAASTSYAETNKSERSPITESKQQPDLTESIVNLKVAEHQAKSSIEVIKTADETLGTLLDVRV